VANVALNETPNVNSLKEKIETRGFKRLTKKWAPANSESVPDFPKLSWEDLRRLTLGSFQLKIAKRYIQEHLKEAADFSILLHRDSVDILRASIESRFHTSSSHSVWIKFVAGDNGFEAITGRYCTCQVGARTLGTCSHITSVIKYLSYDRYQPEKVITRTENPWDAIDCELESESEEEEENETDLENDEESETEERNEMEEENETMEGSEED
jgi:hypothetical protein